MYQKLFITQKIKRRSIHNLKFFKDLRKLYCINNKNSSQVQVKADYHSVKLTLWHFYRYTTVFILIFNTTFRIRNMKNNTKPISKSISLSNEHINGLLSQVSKDRNSYRHLQAQFSRIRNQNKHTFLEFFHSEFSQLNHLPLCSVLRFQLRKKMTPNRDIDHKKVITKTKRLIRISLNARFS